MKNNRHNCKLILEHDPLLKDVFRHNILTEQTDIVKPVWWERISPAFTDMDLNYIMLYLEETYGLTMDKIVQKSIVHQADRNKYHPVRDYLNSLQWDGQERIRYTSIVGWKQGTMTRFKDYGTQRSWVCVNENCKRDAKDLKNENDWHPVTEEEARQMELSFQ